MENLLLVTNFNGSLDGTDGGGATAVRRDGGSGTTMYVKESGSGNTGWSAI